jgi:hypothetical protein
MICSIESAISDNDNAVIDGLVIARQIVVDAAPVHIYYCLYSPDYIIGVVDLPVAEK